MLKRLLIALLITLGTIAVAAPATADDAITDGVPTSVSDDAQMELAAIACPTGQGKVCTYRDTFWQGDMYFYTRPIGPLPYCVNIGGSWNDAISSVRNRSSYLVIFYHGPNCTGSWPPAQGVPPGGNSDWGGTIYNDVWSSLKWTVSP